MSAAFKPLSVRRWVALNPDVLQCTNCRGTGKGLSVRGVVENCVVCEGKGELSPADQRVFDEYLKQVRQDERTKSRWQKLFPVAYAEATGETAPKFFFQEEK